MPFPAFLIKVHTAPAQLASKLPGCCILATECRLKSNIFRFSLRRRLDNKLQLHVVQIRERPSQQNGVLPILSLSSIW
jgi:hypothetical protein